MWYVVYSTLNIHTSSTAQGGGGSFRIAEQETYRRECGDNPVFGCVGPMLGRVGPLLRLCWAYIGVKHVGPPWAYVGTFWAHIGFGNFQVPFNGAKNTGLYKAIKGHPPN